MVKRLLALTIGVILTILGILTLTVMCPVGTPPFFGISLLILGILVTLLALFLLRQCGCTPVTRLIYVGIAVLAILLILLGASQLLAAVCIELGYVAIGLGLLLYGTCILGMSN